jgi:ribosomal silencing factor RsfS
VIVHVFTVAAREFYNLERLWAKPASSYKRKK